MRRSLIASIVVLAPAVAPVAAHADEWSLHVLGSASTAWTDNLTSQPDGNINHRSDVYSQLQPGALFSYETHRSIHELTYNLDVSFYGNLNTPPGAADTEPSLTHHAGWRGFFMTSPLSELSTGLGFSAGTINTFGTTAPAGTPRDTIQPAGTDFRQWDATENFSYTMSAAWRMTQSLLARRFESIVGASGAMQQRTISTGSDAGLTFGLDRAWRDDAVGGSVGARYVTLERENPEPMGGVTTEDNITVQGLLAWRRDISQRWNSVLDAGATALVPINAGEHFTLQPTVGGTLAYAPNWGSASLQARRSVAPNLAIARNTVSDSVFLNAGLPLPWLASDPGEPRLALQATVGGSRTRIIDTLNDDVTDGINVLVGDVALSYRAASALHVILRYQYLRQTSDAELANSFDRQTVQLQLFGRWPDRQAAEIPARDSLRVDRSGNTAVGDEAGAAGGAGASAGASR